MKPMGDPGTVLGIEGGATRTTWMHVRLIPGAESEVLARGELPPVNLRLVSDSRLGDLFRFTPEDVSRVGICLAGCSTETDRARVARVAGLVWPSAQLHIGSDRDSAFFAAFEGEQGVVVIAGTGSAVTGRNGARIEQAGGRGHLLGDRGSAYQLALDAIQSMLESFDLEGSLTPFARTLLEQLSLESLDEIVSWSQKASKSQIAGLAPTVIKAAQNGDARLFRILEDGACALAQYSKVVAKRLELPFPRVVLVGGLFKNSPLYESLFQKALKCEFTESMVTVCEADGAWGAIRYSLASAPVKVDERVLSQVGVALTEQLHPALERADELSTRELVWLFIEDERHVADALVEQIDELSRAVDLAGKAVVGGGRLIYVGAGTSGRLGVLDASEIPPTFGESSERVQGIIAGGLNALHASAEGAEDDRQAGTRAILEKQVRPGDLVCGISASGSTPFVLAALEASRSNGAGTIFLTCNPYRARNGQKWDAEIDLPTGPELITGSTRLKAGTATKVALNIFSTCAMIRLGKVKGNFMIDMQVTNDKLRERAVRFVSQIKACSADEAMEMLERHNWNVRSALGLTR